MRNAIRKILSLLLITCLCFLCIACNSGGSVDGVDTGGGGEEIIPPTPYEVPIVRIDTNGATIDSKIDYVDMTFSIEKVENALTNVDGGIRLRGNSTKDLPKKPFRIKFDKKQSLFGLEKAKSWVLLAEYLDPSGLRNYSAFKLASQMPGLGFTPTPYKVDVYLNGEYIGLYTLCEQVQENEGRMDIEHEEITADMTDLFDFNFFISMDASCRFDEDAVLNETYFYLEDYDRYFELKYPEKDQFVSNEQFLSFFSQLKQYVEYIMYIFETKDEDAIRSATNVESLMDYLMVDVMMGEMDHGKKSFHMYYTNTSSNAENGKLNFGPVWDYDASLYCGWTGKPNVNYTVSNGFYFTNSFFKAIANTPSLYDEVKARYASHGRKAIENTILELEDIIPKIETSLDENHDLWNADLPADTTDKNVEFLLAFLRNRLTVLDNAWT